MRENRNKRGVPTPPWEDSVIVAVAYGTGNDDYLARVLVYRPSRPERGGDEFVVLTWNSADRCEGMGDGEYLNRSEYQERLEDVAWEKFEARAKRLAMRAPEWHAVGLL